MAPPSKKRFRVKEGNSHLTCYPYTYPGGKSGWRFNWRENLNSPWRNVFKETKEEITEAARQKLLELDTGEIIWTALPRARRDFLQAVHREVPARDQQAILAIIANRRKSALIPDAVARFLAFKTPKGKTATPHQEQVGRDLTHLAATHPERILTDLTLPELESWLDSRTGSAGDARRRSIRAALVMFWKWARKDGIAGNDADTLASRLAAVDAPEGKLQILETEELEHLLSLVTPEFFPLVILGAFQGIRPEEIAPKKKSTKPGLRWEHINWEWNTITVPKEVAKTRRKKSTRPRTMPLHPVTRAWLEAAGINPDQTGRICTRNPTEAYQGDDRLTTLWGRALAEKFPAHFSDWPTDALRHSYASYRIAILQNAGQVALEMGNSEGMLHDHYNNPRTSRQGHAWFDFTPDQAKHLPAHLDPARISRKSAANPVGSHKSKSPA
jgi:integrase